jgi:hemin uptake protein HemP
MSSEPSKSELPKDAKQSVDRAVVAESNEVPVDDAADTVAESQAPRSVLLPKIVSFETLAKCGEEVWIEHKGQLYRLRQTRQGKLILTK